MRAQIRKIVVMVLLAVGEPLAAGVLSTGNVPPPENPVLRAEVATALRIGIGITAVAMIVLIATLLIREYRQRRRGGRPS